jgi:hypothetical protein
MPANPAASALAAVELVTNCAIWLSGSARLSASNIRQTPAENLFNAARAPKSRRAGRAII